MGGIYLRVWTEASKIIFEGMLHCGQLKKNEMDGGPFIYTHRTCNYKKAVERGGGGGGSFQV